MRPLYFEANGFSSFFGELLIFPIPAITHGTTADESGCGTLAAIPPATGLLCGVFGFAGYAFDNVRASFLAFF